MSAAQRVIGRPEAGGGLPRPPDLRDKALCGERSAMYITHAHLVWEGVGGGALRSYDRCSRLPFGRALAARWGRFRGEATWLRAQSIFNLLRAAANLAMRDKVPA